MQDRAIILSPGDSGAIAMTDKGVIIGTVFAIAAGAPWHTRFPFGKPWKLSDAHSPRFTNSGEPGELVGTEGDREIRRRLGHGRILPAERHVIMKSNEERFSLGGAAPS
jgi:hypothetical protein